MGDNEIGADTTPLEGGEWVVSAYVDAAGELAVTPAEVRASATFAEGRVMGSGGCNHFSGSYRADGATLDIGEVATTMMACGPEADAVERAVLAALGATAGYAIEDDRLALSDADGRVVLRLVRSTLALAGVEWQAIGINNQRGGVASTVIGTTVTARFGDDGQLTGSGGCNRVFGPYQVDGDSIRIGPLASGRMFCAEPAGAMEQERSYLAALESATTWVIRDGRLQLRDPEGALQVDFRSADQAE